MKQVFTLFIAFACISIPNTLKAQISGAVFKDFNANGTKDANEPFAAGVVVNAYNAADALVATATTTAPLSGTTNYSFTPPAYPVRLEFIIPSAGGTGCINPLYDFPGYAGSTYGTNVKFIAATTTTANFAINNPAEYVKTTNPYYYTIRQVAGNPLAGSGTATTRTGIEGTPYLANLNSVGTTTPAQRKMAVSYIGNCYGLAYSKQAGKIFTSAHIKRHFGLGPLGSGGIYMLDTALGTPASAASVQFYNMDANGHNTRSGVSAPAYGVGSSFNVPSSSSITYLGSTDAVTGYPLGMGVIGSNTQRGLQSNAGTPTNDTAAFGQVGIYGLGDLEISDDGADLFSVDLYDRKVYKLTLNSTTNPTGVSAVSSYALPSPPLRNTLGGGYATTYAGDNSQFYDGTKGLLRPFALKYYRGKLYVGAVTTGEKAGAATTTDNNTGNPEYTDLWAYVFEFDPSTNTWASSPVLQFPLNFNRGTNVDAYNETFQLWKNTSFSSTYTWNGGIRLYYAQAMFTDIEFDPADGSMMLGLRDRIGDQVGHFQYRFTGTGTMVATALGDVLRAYRNSSCSFELESNGKEGVSSTKAATSGAFNGQGPGNGEFYYHDNIYDGNDGSPNYTYHLNITEGSLAILPGTGHVMTTTMDPSDVWQQGIDWFSNTTGDNVRSHVMEEANDDNNSTGYSGKGFGLGDIELLSYEAPIEIGNRIWNDANGDGIQNPAETGLNNVTVDLFADFNNDGTPDGASLASTTTNGTGSWFFNNSNITDGDPVTGGNQAGLKRNATYIVRIATSDWNSVTGAGINDLAGYQLSITNKVGYGQLDFSDNDASLTSGATVIPQLTFTTGDPGENAHNTDFGFKPLATIGNKVWRDDNSDGNQDAGEPGIAGITITLYNSTGGVQGTTVTDAYGNYFFDNLPAANYSIGCTLPANYTITTQTNTVDNTDGTKPKDLGSDINQSTGKTYTIALSSGEIENNIDIGLIFTQPAITASIGDKVWLDTNEDGSQTSGEPGVSGVTVTLYASGVAITTTITDVNGNYLFTNVPAASDYTIGITLPSGMVFTTKDQGGNDNTDNDIDPTTDGVGFGKTDPFTVAASQLITNKDAGIKPQSGITGSLGDFVWEDIDRDGIQDAGEPGIAGVLVKLLDANQNPVLAGGNPVTTVTDAFGKYQFNNLTPAYYFIDFVKPSGYLISPAFQGSNAALDNNADVVTGSSNWVTLPLSDRVSTIDAGMYLNVPLNSTASLGNIVWRDDNKNGVINVGEPGIAGITVQLLDGIGNPILSGGHPVTATTDQNGNYMFVNLTPGTYSVAFTNLPTGFVFTTKDAGANDALDSDVNPATGVTSTVTVIAGQYYTDIDAGLVQGTPAGKSTIGNKVWYDLDNDGLQDAGELGVSKVTVTLKSPGTDGIAGNGDDITIATTITNALGEYVFGGLDVGNYYLSFSTLPSGFNVSASNVGTDDTIDSDGGTISSGASVTAVYNIAQGDDNLTIDLGLNKPSTNSFGDFVWFDSDSDGVQDAGEAGVPGVQVSLLNVSGVPILNGGDPVLTTTDANGQYLFAGLADGTYSAGFTNLPAGFTLTTKSVINDVTGSDVDIVTAVTPGITLNSGNNHDLSLDAGVTSTRAILGNFVWNDTDGDGIQDAGEPAIPGVTVTLYAGDGTTVIAAAITDQNGKYLFANLTAGSYIIGFSTIPANTVFTTKDAATENLGTDSDVDPSSGKTGIVVVTTGEVNLKIDAGIKTIIPASVGDYVWLDTDGNGIQGAAESVIGGVIVTLYDVSNNSIGAAITDGNGNYHISNVTPGSGYYLVFTNKPGGAWTTPVVGGGGASNNSKANAIGKTSSFSVSAGDNIVIQDAGIAGWQSTAVLPVSLLDFVVTKNGSLSSLKWSITNEINSGYINVERSTDGTRFSSIERVNAKSGAGINYYNYDDIKPSEGKNYYRLNFVGSNGKTQYSIVRLVRFDRNSRIDVYPNPVSYQLSITFSENWTNKSINITVYNQLGQNVLSQKIGRTQQTEQLDINKLPVGMYMLKLLQTGTNEVEYRKIKIIR